MATEKLTIGRGLVQLKLNQKKINKALEKCFISIKIGQKELDDKCDPKAAMDSIKDLIDYGDKLKAAIMAANSVTEVTVNDEKMTIAAAIEKKRTIGNYENLLRHMKRQLSTAQQKVDYENDDAKIRLDRLLEANFGKDLKARDTEIDSITKAFNASNEAVLVDPINLEARINDLEEYVDGFKAEVDLTLSEANATTYIEI